MASVAAAVGLVALKLITGIATGSLGLVSAGIESSGDVVAAVLTLLAVRLAARPADEDHPYGHRRAENLAALGEAAILIGGAVFIAIAAGRRLAQGHEPLDATWVVFVVIAIAICVDVTRVSVSLRTAAQYGSPALRSNAFHFSADLAGSIAVLGGLVAVAAGFGAGDAIAALLVATVILVAAGRLVYENARVLMDTTPEAAHAAALEAIATAAPAAEVRRVRVRESAGRYFADVVVGVAPAQRVVEGHQTADAIEEAVERALPDADVVVHVEPGVRDLSLRDRILEAALGCGDVQEVHDVNVFEHERGAIVSLHLKFPREMSLDDAHRTADEVEARLLRIPGVAEARTHLEPLEPAGRAARDDPPEGDVERHVRALVEAAGAGAPRSLRVLRTRPGLVVLLTVSVGADASLREAHDLAGARAEAIRRGQPGVAEVVVHTEP
jgi:cation diffusion facilitator family transporter